MPYAQNTQVSVERSRSEVERILKTAGATKMGFFYNEQNAIVGFELSGYSVKLQVRVPGLDEMVHKIQKGKESDKPRGWWCWDEKRRRTWCAKEQEAETRRKWRVLILLLKAKLEAIADGETTVEREFLSDLVIPGGQTVGEALQHRLVGILAGESQLLLGMGEE